ncbi:MAG: dephospho-CoA kinase [Microbacteriaceae bacterium]
MRLIGLTGGIASGKSVVASRLRDHGAIVIDADVVAREVVEPGAPALDEIRDAFGDEVIAADGSLDRAALGAIVFSDPERRSVLNGITHPAVWRRTDALIAAAREADPDAVVVYDVPLLVEAGTARQLDFDHIVVVQADAEERVRRMVQLRGMTEEAARSRIAAQATDAERRAVADTVISSDGSLAETLAAVDAAWSEIAGA